MVRKLLHLYIYIYPGFFLKIWGYYTLLYPPWTFHDIPCLSAFTPPGDSLGTPPKALYPLHPGPRPYPTGQHGPRESPGQLTQAAPTRKTPKWSYIPKNQPLEPNVMDSGSEMVFLDALIFFQS